MKNISGVFALPNSAIAESNLIHPEIIPATEKMQVPIRLYVSDTTQPDAAAKQQLQCLAEADGPDHYAVALPDIHAKSRNIAPTGSVVVSRDNLMPMAIDKGVNCGMRMVLTGLQAADLSTADIDRIFEGLAQAIPGRRHINPIIPRAEMIPLLLKGGRWAVDYFNVPASDLPNIERNGSVFDGQQVDEAQLLMAVSPDIIKKGPRSLGSLGGGNHFLEMQEVVDVLDSDTARLLGLKRGQLIFMLHTGSGRIGSMVMRYYSGHAIPSEPASRLKLFKRKRAFHEQGLTNENRALRERYFGNGRSFFTIPADSSEGQRMMIALQAADNFGFVNRMVITQALRQTVRSVLSNESLDMPLLYDCSHVSIQSETHFGERLWVHRHGASRALPASAMPDHPVFSITGQPLPIPGSMGADSYIGVTASGAAQTFNSVNHGAGRLMDKPEARESFQAQNVEANLQAQNIRLYRTGTSDIAEQSPQSFKDITEVIHTMQRFDLARPVVRLRPVAVLKG